MYAIVNLIAAFFRLLVVKTNPNNLANIEQVGAMAPGGAIMQALAALSTNASPVFGNWSTTLIPASLTAYTIPAGALLSGIIRRFSPGAAFTDCTDTATNIVNAIPGAIVGQTFPLLIANLGSGIGTIGAGTGVTIAGTATIATAATRLFLGQVTGSTTVTLTSCFQWGNGSQYANTVGL